MKKREDKDRPFNAMVQPFKVADEKTLSTKKGGEVLAKQAGKTLFPSVLTAERWAAKGYGTKAGAREKAKVRVEKPKAKK